MLLISSLRPYSNNNLAPVEIDISLNQQNISQFTSEGYLYYWTILNYLPFFHLFCVKVILEGDKDKYVIFWEITATTLNAFKGESGKINWVEITWLK